MDIGTLMRPDLAALQPYTPIVPFEALSERLGIPAHDIVKLDANENPYGPSPRAIAALASYPHYAIYPDPDHTSLRRAIAAYIDQPIERIVCGNGSDEIIDLLLRLIVAPGDAVVEAPPTFGMYRFNAGVVGGRAVQAPRDERFDVDVEMVGAAVEREQAKIIFLPSPNNPTGNSLRRGAVERLLELPALLVVDEAYAEFAGDSVADLVGRHPNLIVLRTFSKWAGLAGLRVGYGLMDEALAAQLWKIKPPYNVNVAANVAAIASLDDAAYLMSNVGRIVAERERVFAALREIPGLQPYPSSANFVLMRVSGVDAAGLKHDLEQQGILLRYYSTAGLADCVRISIGTPEQNDRALAAMRELVGQAIHNGDGVKTNGEP